MQTKIFRLFVSSTFSDFVKEREILHTKVFPKIGKYCLNHGFQFQPIDLRWGVNNESQLDQKTLDICLGEVKACKHFPHPNFLIMAGDRYGYVPLPYMIERNEFEQLIRHTRKNEKEIILSFKSKSTPTVSRKITQTNLLLQWYMLDNNQIPASYVLQRREDNYREYKIWEVEESAIRQSLQSAAKTIFKDAKETLKYKKYFLSATEQEVIEGICEYEKKVGIKSRCDARIDKDYVFGFLRSIDKNPEKNAMKFRDNLERLLLKNHTLINQGDNYLLEFEQWITEKLIKSVKKQIENIDSVTVLEQETIEQEKFLFEKLHGFMGRRNTLSRINKYAKELSNNPLIVFGASGTGKSALMAKAIEEVRTTYNQCVIYRFVGATASSSNLRSLLISIVEELKSMKIVESKEVYETDPDIFYQQISLILSSINDSTIIFIDAIDQLLIKDNLKWLPEVLKGGKLKLVISTLKDKNYKEDSHYYNLLEQRFDNSSFIDISKDTLASEANKLIDYLLRFEKRKLTIEQKSYVLQQFKNAQYSPLYLRIVLEEIKQWKSYDFINKNTGFYTGKKQCLNDSVKGAIIEFIEGLVKFYYHEKILVDKMLGYIHCSKKGLSETELLEILSEDLEDQQNFQHSILNEFHTPVRLKNNRRENNEELSLPLSVWIRLNMQFKPFIIEKNLDNQPLMHFFHRQFITVIEDYIKETKTDFHKKLADYFHSIQNRTKTWSKRYNNLRMLEELPYQLYEAKNTEGLKNILFDLEFAGSIFDNNKHESFINILQKADQLTGIKKTEIYPWESFYSERKKVLLESYEDSAMQHMRLFQLAHEDGDDSPISAEAEQLLIDNKIDWYWLKNEWRQKRFFRLGIIQRIDNLYDKISKKGFEFKYKLIDGSTLSFVIKDCLSVKIVHPVSGEKIIRNKWVCGEYGMEDEVSLSSGKKIKWFEELSNSNHYTLELYHKNEELAQYLMGHDNYVGQVFELENGDILTWSQNGDTIIIYSVSQIRTKSLREGRVRSLPFDTIFEHETRIISWDKNDTRFDFATVWGYDGNVLTIYRGDFSYEIEKGDLIEKHASLISPLRIEENSTIEWKENAQYISIINGEKRYFLKPYSQGDSGLIKISGFLFFKFLGGFLAKYSLYNGNVKIMP